MTDPTKAVTQIEAVTRASHELRGPLTAARLAIQLAMRRGGLTETSLRAIELELEWATLALSDLDAALGAHAPARKPESVNVRELLEDSVEAWQASALARNGRLELEWVGGDAVAWGDRLRFAQATGNLIANAIEHGGAEVSVRGRLEGDSVRIEVADTGPGLAAPVAELMRRARENLGLRGRGLAIAASAAEAYGGRLAAAPAESGARLVLELPVATQAQSANTASSCP